MESDQEEKLISMIRGIDKNLKGYIEKAGAKEYTGTSFRRDFARKLGVDLNCKKHLHQSFRVKMQEEKDERYRKPSVAVNDVDEMNYEEDLKKESLNIEKLNNDLFADFGFGIQSWIQTLLSLVGIYAVISLFAGGIMYIYG